MIDLEARYYPRSKILMVSGGAFILTMKIENWWTDWKHAVNSKFTEFGFIKTSDWELNGAHFSCSLKRKETK